MRLSVRLLCMSTILAAGLAVHAAEDWPKWRGPRADGISKETLPDSLPATPKKIWSATIGLGYSSPIAVNGTLYAFATDDDKKEECLYAFNAADGKLLWKQPYAQGDVKDGGYKGTRATPVFEDGKIYTFGGSGHVTCWDATAEGKKLWQTNVLKECNTKSLNWGTASNPLFIGERLYVQVGDGGPMAVGLNKKSGQIEWKTEAKGQASYTSPILADVGGTKQMILLTGTVLCGVDLDSGKTIWDIPYASKYNDNGSTPVYRDGHLLVSNSTKAATMLKLSPTGATTEWELKDFATKFQGFILDGDYVYGNSAGKLCCLHWPDGKILWTEDIKLGPGGSIVRAGDKILALSERGKFSLLKANGPDHQQLGESALFEGANQLWATPLLYNGKLYTKGGTGELIAKGGNELICYDLNAK